MSMAPEPGRDFQAICLKLCLLLINSLNSSPNALLFGDSGTFTYAEEETHS